MFAEYGGLDTGPYPGDTGPYPGDTGPYPPVQNCCATPVWTHTCLVGVGETESFG